MDNFIFGKEAVYYEGKKIPNGDFLAMISHLDSKLVDKVAKKMRDRAINNSIQMDITPRETLMLMCRIAGITVRDSYSHLTLQKKLDDIL